MVKDEFEILYFTQITKLLATLVDNPSFKDKQQVLDLCLLLLNSVYADKLKYQDKKQLQKFLAHLMRLLLLLFSFEVQFSLDFVFYELFWRFIKDITAGLTVEQDFDNMESFVKSQMLQK